tara:strand:- start:840 stop:1463 length:624 start_codon:yes stop_codon:yes gene_type:complete
MPGLLDYTMKGYQDGGSATGSYNQERDYSVDIDPYANTSLADQLNRMNITVDNDAMGLLPTYDTTGANLARQAYDIRSDATRATATGNLLDLTKQRDMQAGSTGFSGAGAGVKAYTDVREDVVGGYGAQAQEQYLGLQRDIYGIQRDYQRELTSAIGDLDEDDYSFAEGGDNANIVTTLPMSNQGTVWYNGMAHVWSEEEGQYVPQG